MDFNLSEQQQQIVDAAQRVCAPFDADYWLRRDAMQWFWDHSAGPADRPDPVASPLHGDLAGLPPAVIITAEGEKAAAQSVADAAAMLSKIPGGINIRTLQTLEKIAVEPSQKTLVVLPSELTNLKDLFSK